MPVEARYFSMLPNDSVSVIQIQHLFLPNETVISTAGLQFVASPETLKFSFLIKDWPAPGAVVAGILFLKS